MRGRPIFSICSGCQCRWTGWHTSARRRSRPACWTPSCSSASMAVERPLIVEVEDLHWIDAASEEWLAQPTERLGGVGLLLVTTYRPRDRPPPPGKTYLTPH